MRNFQLDWTPPSTAPPGLMPPVYSPQYPNSYSTTTRTTTTTIPTTTTTRRTTPRTTTYRIPDWLTSSTRPNTGPTTVSLSLLSRVRNLHQRVLLLAMPCGKDRCVEKTRTHFGQLRTNNWNSGTLLSHHVCDSICFGVVRTSFVDSEDQSAN